jgi:hypothetical protein
MTKKHKPYKCIVCKRILKKDKEYGVVDGATFDITFGYPTLLDGIQLLGSICVPCTDKLATAGVLQFVRDEFACEKKYIPLNAR